MQPGRGAGGARILVVPEVLGFRRVTSAPVWISSLLPLPTFSPLMNVPFVLLAVRATARPVDRE